MFFGIVQDHNGEYQSGLYYEKYPDLKEKQIGIFFRYKEQQKTAQKEDIINNLAHDNIQKVIESTYEIPWKSESYVLLSNELWRIISTSKSPTNEQAATIVKKCRNRYSITLRKVSNALEMEI
jgi:hypothetical protein